MLVVAWSSRGERHEEDQVQWLSSWRRAAEQLSRCFGGMFGTRPREGTANARCFVANLQNEAIAHTFTSSACELPDKTSSSTRIVGYYTVCKLGRDNNVALMLTAWTATTEKAHSGLHGDCVTRLKYPHCGLLNTATISCSEYLIPKTDEDVVLDRPLQVLRSPRK